MSTSRAWRTAENQPPPPRHQEEVQAKVLSHYRSELVEQIRANGGLLFPLGIDCELAKEFAFAYGVERAIDLAIRRQKYFSDVSPKTPIYLLGESSITLT